MTGEEHATRVRPFLSRYERARLDDLAPGSKKRTRLLNRLCHGSEDALDWRRAEAAAGGAREIAARIKALGGSSTCYVLAVDGAWDGREVPLDEVLAALYGSGLPVLLACGPVAYFEPEYVAGAGRRYLLCVAN
jgi:hypothetical protein